MNPSRSRTREAVAVARAVKLLGPKVIGYHPEQGWLLVSKIEADAIVKALKLNGISAKTCMDPLS